MARIPEGAALIDNPISASRPGFTLENVHVMAGVPAIFQAMVASGAAHPDRAASTFAVARPLQINAGARVILQNLWQ